MACEPDSLAESAKCFECLGDDAQAAVQTYLLAQIAGGSTDPGTLLEQAKDFLGLNEQQSQAVQTYLLCQISQ